MSLSEWRRQADRRLHQAATSFMAYWGTSVLVETLLERGADGDLAEAEAAIRA